MQVTLAVYYIFSFLYILLDLNQALISYKKIQTEDSKDSGETEGFVSCICDGLIITEQLPRDNLDNVFTSLEDYSFCRQNFSLNAICYMIRKCSICKAQMSMCYDVSSKEGKRCIKREIEMRGYAVEGSNGSILLRQKRIPHNCTFPSYMHTSNLRCVESVTSMACTQKCSYGYTLDEGITRQMKCKYSENVWKPLGFEECSLFFDCHVDLIAAGKVFCKTGTPYIAPECNITCDHYEDKPALPPKIYQCEATDEWAKKLPHCVVPATARYLVPAPRVKFHTADLKEKLHGEMDLKEKPHKAKYLSNRGPLPKIHPKLMKGFVIHP